jgi:hypothetical protein
MTKKEKCSSKTHKYRPLEICNIHLLKVLILVGYVAVSGWCLPSVFRLLHCLNMSGTKYRWGRAIYHKHEYLDCTIVKAKKTASPTDWTAMPTILPVRYMFLWMSAQNAQEECITGNVTNVFPSETTKQILEANLYNSMLCNSQLKYTSI